MRFKLPKSGDTRVVEGFLFLPKEINDEIRWLELAYWEETFRATYMDARFKWRPDRWLTFTEYYFEKYGIDLTKI